jgi:hypothetical protein
MVAIIKYVTIFQSFLTCMYKNNAVIDMCVRKTDNAVI